ncbi:acyloxyacyl hydrolase [Muriicola sp. SD30]|uniref:acyloxyacyl hydrolase n=1 Tax=Muriicola sp. SD30 TaxID=3240936 RepID=UPI00350F9DE5
MKIRILLLCLLCFSLGYAQQEDTPVYWNMDVTPFYGSILLHNTDISHLIREHPSGVIFGFNKQTFGHEGWEAPFNFPDTGVSLVYQDMKNSTLGHNLGVYLHYNFYLLKRKLQFRIGQGIAYNTNPYNKEENFRNNAYGSHLMSSTFLVFNYHRPRLYKNLGVKAGISLIHYSNANVKAPNTSTNTFAFNAGLIYDLKGGTNEEFIRKEQPEIRESVKMNLVFRSGINESDIINSGQYPFYIFSAYADKRLGKFSAIQLGSDVFYSNFLKELIRFQSISFPELEVDPATDFKRVGIFVGHELFINKLSVITQLGYYVYYPFDFEGQVYNRVGVKRYFGDKWFAALSLKSHAAKAEAVELGIGIRL